MTPAPEHAHPEPTTAALSALVDTAEVGLCVLDADGVTVHINTAGAELLATPVADLLGQRSPFAELTDDGTHVVGALDVTVGPLRADLCHGNRPGRTVSFRTRRLTDWSRQLSAFANTAADIARESTLTVVLDRLAAEVRTVTGMATAAVVLMDGPEEQFRYVGWSGLPPDYVERFEAARQNGAPMVTLDAYRARRTIVAHGVRTRVLADPRWEPAHDLVRDVDWETFVAVPLVVRGRAIGVLTGFHPAGRDPTPEDIRFVSVMADHAAIAVDSARMFARLQRRAADHERARLARDLHDSVNQALFSLTMQSRGVELRVGDGDAELTRELRELRELAQGALREMRMLIQARRPVELRDGGLPAGLRSLARTAGLRAGTAVTVQVPDSPVLLDDFLEEDLFRVVQEALHNVDKHASAGDIVVEMTIEQGRLHLSVTDDGRGIGASAYDDGIGMSTMRERVEHHGGQLDIGSGPGGRGTRVHAAVPLPPAAEREEGHHGH